MRDLRKRANTLHASKGSRRGSVDHDHMDVKQGDKEGDGMVDFFVKHVTRRFSENNKKEQRKDSDTKDDPNKEGYNIAPDLDEIDKMSAKQLDTEGGNTIHTKEQREKILKYREHLLSKK